MPSDRVALKVLPATLATDPDRLRRFEHEALAAAALNHPNLLAVYDIGTSGPGTYLVSELLEGQTLREYLLHGPLPVRKALDYAIQIANGLAAAHEKGIVHRDLKPENIFLTRDGPASAGAGRGADRERGAHRRAAVRAVVAGAHGGEAGIVPAGRQDEDV